MGCFEKCVSPIQDSPPDPTKHVNYVQGMVLGVDEFTQEFAYLSGRDQWLARDCIGYGTVCGLQVSFDTTPGKPQIVVAPGHAVSPYGMMIRVGPAQCAGLNDWLTTKDAVDGILAAGSPPDGQVTLYVTLRYRDCLTDEMPLPGSPCRSEDAATTASRIDDAFTISLDFSAPPQREETAIREYCVWLRNLIETVDDSSGTALAPGSFIGEMRSMIRLISSPPEDLSAALSASPPQTLQVKRSDMPEMLRAAMLVWVTDVRPLFRVQGPWKYEQCGCAGATIPSVNSDAADDRILLAKIMLPVVHNAIENTWSVDETALLPDPDSYIDQTERPYVLSVRMAQEMLLYMQEAATAPAPALPSVSMVAAAGIVRGDNGNGQPSFNNLRVDSLTLGEIVFTFDNYHQPDGTFMYIVKVLAVTNPAVLVPTVRFKGFGPKGFSLRINSGSKLIDVATLSKLEFVLEVSRYEK